MTNIISNKEVIESVRERVLNMLGKRRNGSWQGTMSELMTAISGRRAPEVFPGSASSLRRIVNKVLPSLRKQGYAIQFTRTTDSDRRRIVTFTRKNA